MTGPRHPASPPVTDARPRRRRRAVTALLVGAALAAAPLLAETGARDPDDAPAVEPVGEWVRIVDIAWSERRVGLHLRTGYARPLVFPEPVRRADASVLAGADVRIDDELVVFEPASHFAAEPIDFVGLDSARVYRFRVRSSTAGKRVPLRIVIP